MNTYPNHWTGDWALSVKGHGAFIMAKLDEGTWRFLPDGCHCGDKTRGKSKGEAQDGHTTEAAAQLCAARLRNGA